MCMKQIYDILYKGLYVFQMDFLHDFARLKLFEILHSSTLKIDRIVFPAHICTK